MAAYRFSRGMAYQPRPPCSPYHRPPQGYEHGAPPQGSSGAFSYRSRGESLVGHVLTQAGIPFQYERATAVVDRGRRRTWHPDFTLPTYGDLILEYAGMPDRHDYRLGLDHKQWVYGANGLPALFVYPADLYGACWPQRMVDRVERLAADVERSRKSHRIESDES